MLYLAQLNSLIKSVELGRGYLPTYCLRVASAVQVNSADQHLRVYDSAQKRWRQVCSSSANELLASISCEEVGFVR